MIRPGKNVIKRAAFGEMAASFAGVLLLMAAYGQWLLPAGILKSDTIAFQLAGSASFMVFACLLYFIARRGMCPEIQIDMQKQVVRTAKRNRHGASTATETFPFAAIGSVFMKRSKTNSAGNQVFLRLRGDQRLIEVASGPESQLEIIMERLGQDVCRTAPVAPTRAPVKLRSSKPRPMRTAFAAR